MLHLRREARACETPRTEGHTHCDRRASSSAGAWASMKWSIPAALPGLSGGRPYLCCAACTAGLRPPPFGDIELLEAATLLARRVPSCHRLCLGPSVGISDAKYRAPDVDGQRRAVAEWQRARPIRHRPIRSRCADQSRRGWTVVVSAVPTPSTRCTGSYWQLVSSRSDPPPTRWDPGLISSVFGSSGADSPADTPGNGDEGRPRPARVLPRCRHRFKPQRPSQARSSCTGHRSRCTRRRQQHRSGRVAIGAM